MSAFIIVMALIAIVNIILVLALNRRESRRPKPPFCDTSPEQLPRAGQLHGGEHEWHEYLQQSERVRKQLESALRTKEPR